MREKLCERCVAVIQDHMQETACPDYLALMRIPLNPKKGDCDDQTVANAVYCLLWRNILAPNETCLATLCRSKKVYRGDTMNSFNTVCRNTKAKYPFYDGSCEEKIEQFRSSYHTIANFLPLGNVLAPMLKRGNTLNMYRGNYQKYGDFFDLFLALICDWYNGKDNERHTHMLELLSINEADYFGKFKDFKGFIDRNYLSEYVDEHYNVLPMFGSLEGRLNGNPRPQTLEEIVNYLQRSAHLIQSRAVSLADQLEELVAVSSRSGH